MAAKCLCGGMAKFMDIDAAGLTSVIENADEADPMQVPCICGTCGKTRVYSLQQLSKYEVVSGRYRRLGGMGDAVVIGT